MANIIDTIMDSKKEKRNRNLSGRNPHGHSGHPYPDK